MTLQDAMGACMCVKGGTDKAVFEAYVEEVLAPSLVAGQVVVLDSLGAHRTARVRELIEGRGAIWCCCPVVPSGLSERDGSHGFAGFPDAWNL